MDKFQRADYDWLLCMMRIGRKETVCFENDSVGYTNQIVDLNCRRGIMVWVYSTLKVAKKVTPIEALEVDVKNKMWAFVNEICAGKEVDKRRKIEIAKVFYVIEYFINENK
jgi:hypothetical protein